jgi:NAD(P)-dependent dehydrogenase (short-subunit alcohol dehydrogenase family)
MILDRFSVAGKVAIVTGAGLGIGRGIALGLAEAGADVVLAARTKSDLEQVAGEVRSLGRRALVVPTDVTDATACEQLVTGTVEEFGRLDILVNNAGILRDRMSFTMEEEDWDSVIKVHLKGHFVPTRFAAAHWRQVAKETGAPVNAKVVNTSSESGLYGNAGQLNYAAAKAGIAAMTIVLARELERFGVRVNGIAPVARTRLTEALAGFGDALAPVEGEFDKWAPENVASVVAWLASDLSEGVSGQILKVQGGLMRVMRGWEPAAEARADDVWTIDRVNDEARLLFEQVSPLVPPFPTS